MLNIVRIIFFNPSTLRTAGEHSFSTFTTLHGIDPHNIKLNDKNDLISVKLIREKKLS